MTDAELLDRFRSGDMEAAGALYDRHAPKLYAYVRSLRAGAPDAEDMVQESFLKLLDYGGRARIGNVRGLLFTIARNLVRNDARRAAQQERAGAPRDVDAMGGPEVETLAALRAAIARLPADQQETLVLKIWGGLTFEEIGEVTGVTGATAASRYRYALEKLAGSLTKGVRDER